MGKNSGDIHEEMDNLLSDEDDGDEPEEEDELDCPSIKLIKTENLRLRKLWKQTLIIKLLGRRIGYTLLLRKIKELWRPKAMVDLVALDDDFFLAKFSSIDDYCDPPKLVGPLTNCQLAKNLWMSSDPIPHYCVPLMRPII